MLFVRSGPQDVANLKKDLWPSGKGLRSKGTEFDPSMRPSVGKTYLSLLIL